MSRTIAIAYRFTNGEVRAFDATGFQIREYDGAGPEAWEKIKAAVPRGAKLVENADWNLPWDQRKEPQ
jgi:hypothetical protein